MKRHEYTLTLYTPHSENTIVVDKGPARAVLSAASILRAQLRPADFRGAQVAIWCPELSVHMPIRSWRVVAERRGPVDVIRWRLEYRHGRHHRPREGQGVSP